MPSWRLTARLRQDGEMKDEKPCTRAFSPRVEQPCHVTTLSLRGAQRRSNLLPDERTTARQAGDCFGARRLAMTGCSGDSNHSENALAIMNESCGWQVPHHRRPCRCRRAATIRRSARHLPGANRFALRTSRRHHNHRPHRQIPRRLPHHRIDKLPLPVPPTRLGKRKREANQNPCPLLRRKAWRPSARDSRSRHAGAQSPHLAAPYDRVASSL